MTTALTPSSRVTRVDQESIAPNVDIVETPTAYRLVADLPGVAPEEIGIALEKDRLTLEAPSNLGTHEGMRLIHREFEVGDYHRAFRLGFRVDPQRIEAVCQNGRLELTLAKAADEQPRRIPVKATTH